MRPVKLSKAFFVVVTLLVVLAASAYFTFLKFYDTQSGAESPVSRTQYEPPGRFTWDLSKIFPDWEAWEAGMEKAEARIDAIAAMKGQAGRSPENLQKALQLNDELFLLFNQVYLHAQLSRAVDYDNQEIASRFQRVKNLLSQFATATSWLYPEILAIPQETVEQWITENEGLSPYRFKIHNMFRRKAHSLGEAEEKLLSYFFLLNDSPRSIYYELSTTDIKFETISLSNGKEITTSRSNCDTVLKYNRNQEDRKKAFESYCSAYKKNENTYAAIMNSLAQRDWAKAQARGFDSCLEAVLDGDNIPVEVYTNLIETVRANTAPLQRYHHLRKNFLGLEKYHFYDRDLPLVESDNTFIHYRDAKIWTNQAVKPLGEDYFVKMRSVFTGRWIDVYRRPGKQEGNFTARVYRVHPYILVNYGNTLNSALMLSHELGHALHFLYTEENQPVATSIYTAFVAEVASTLNEQLLLDYLLEREKDPREKLKLIEQAIIQITGTFYSPAFYAEFELRVRERVENGEPITAEILNAIMARLYSDYFGDSVEHCEMQDLVWIRVSHIFDSPLYVYQYATSFAVSAQLFQQLTTGPEEAREITRQNYIELLKSGGNDYPVNQLKTAGVDCTDPELIEAVARQLDDLIDQLETILSELEVQ